MNDFIHKAHASSGNIRATVVNCTQLIDQLSLNFGANPLATMALGRTVSSALLLASHTKKDHRISLHFKGDGALGDVYADADFEAGARGYVANPQALPEIQDGSLNFAAGIGKGQLFVSTHIATLKHPQISCVEIITGEIGDDIAHYLMQSQQVKSIVQVGCSLHSSGRIKIAGGLLIEAMQCVDEEEMLPIVEQIYQSESITQRLDNYSDVIEFVQPLSPQLKFTKTEFTTHPHLRCSCSRERVISSLNLVSEADLQEDADQSSFYFVRCQFCGKDYQIEKKSITKK